MSDRKTVPAQIGSKQFLVETSVDDRQPEISESESGIRQTGPTFSKLTANASENLIDVVNQVRTEFNKHWEEVMETIPAPAEMSLELAFAFESGINAWVVVGKGTAGVKVVLKWIRSEQ